MTRKILFDKRSVTTNVVEKEAGKNDNEARVDMEIKGMLAWINSHEYFKWSRMCLKIGVDKSNFQKALKTGTFKVSQEQITQMLEILGGYGYGK